MGQWDGANSLLQNSELRNAAFVAINSSIVVLLFY